MNNRLLKLDLSRADEEKGIPATLSTETPVQRNGYSEVLVHTQNSVTIRDNKSSLPLLVGHDSSEPAIGKITDIQVRDGKLKGMIKFGNTMEDAKKTKKEWLIEAQQEALDMAVYLEKCIQDEDETIVSWEGEDVKVKQLEDSYGGTIWILKK
mgnify:CR=1 FL=1